MDSVLTRGTLSLLVASALLLACDSEPVDPNAHQNTPVGECTPGVSAGCTCPDQTPSQLQCSPGGVWGQCACSDLQTGGTTTEPLGTGGVIPSGGAIDSGGMDTTVSPQDDQPPCAVAKILAEHCQGCHGAQTKFGAPMPMLTVTDLTAPAPSDASQRVIDLLPGRVRDDNRPMPPAGNERLSEADLQVLDEWIAGGALPGQDSCEVTIKPIDQETGEAPDDCEDFHELRAHGSPTSGDTTPFQVPSTLTANSGNLYECFYFDVPYADTPQALWFSPIIDDERVVHHWILYGNDGTAGPVAADGAMRACNANQAGSYFISGWAPGAGAIEMPQDVGLRMPSGPNARLMLEVHYYNGAQLTDAADRSGVRFCTASKERRVHEAAVHTLGSEGICLEPGGKHTVTGECDPPDNNGDIHIISLWPHMHKFATRQRIEVVRGNETIEIHNEPFSFDSQVTYSGMDVVIKPGDRVRTHCEFENSSSDRVPFGEQTQEEMCFNFVTAWPAGALANPDAAGFPRNRCVPNLSILQSCNGVLDAPVTTE